MILTNHQVQAQYSMNILSLFDGMSCGRVALERAGVPITNYYASEIDKYALKVSKHNYPDIIQLGDVKELKADSLPKIDLVIGGFPCQSFSLSGKQLGFEDARGTLFYECVRLLEEVKPTYFLFENVGMKKEYEDYISNALGVEPIIINSSLVSAQNRKRLYWTNIPNVAQPEYKGITWVDIREYGVNSENYYYSHTALQWLIRSSRKRDKHLTIHGNDDKMQMLEASHCKKYSNQRFFGILDKPSSVAKYNSMVEEYGIQFETQDAVFLKHDDIKNCLYSVDKDGNRQDFTKEDTFTDYTSFVRYITPIECERLQTLPDGYTACVSNTQRYKMLGNGWTVDVITHILKGLK